jgi:hypothetical protein
MKINFGQSLKELDGKAIKNGEKDLTLKAVACNALGAIFNDDQMLSGEEKAKRGLLAMRLYANPDIDLTIEELALTKKLIGKAYGPIVIAQAWAMLEGK